MALANVALIDTFDTWRLRTNQLVIGYNLLTEGSHNTTGTITIANSGVALNVTQGVIRVKANTFDANALTFVSNTSALRVSGTGRLGTTVYIDTGTFTTSLADANTANIASAAVVNTLNNTVVSIFRQSNTNFNSSNVAFAIANLAYDRANSGVVNVGVTAPSPAANGQLWWNNEYGRLLIYYKDDDTQQWVDTNPSNEFYKVVYDTANVAFDTANTTISNSTIALSTANAANSLAANALLRTGGTITGNVVFTGAANLVLSGAMVSNRSNVHSQTLTDGATINWDVSQGQVAYVTIAGARSMATPTNLRVGTYILHVIQDGTGSRTLSWSSAFKWTAGTPPVLSTAASARDIFSFISDGTNLYGSFLPNVK